MPLHPRRHGHEGHLHFITFCCYRRLPCLNNEAAYTYFEQWLETLRALALAGGLGVKRTVDLLMAVQQGFGRYTSADPV